MKNFSLVPSGMSAYGVLRVAIGFVLLTAAILKAWELATVPLLSSGILDARWLLIAVVECELLFGLWLLSGLLPRATWAVALACFSVFACVSLYKALSGYATCGCFGRVRVNPWYTCGFDSAIVALLLCWRPRIPIEPQSDNAGEGQIRPRRLGLGAMAILAVLPLAGPPAAYVMGSYVEPTLSEAGDITGDGKTVVLDPERWLGKRFPLLPFIDIGGRLEKGDWLVILYRHDCPRCRAALRELSRIAREAHASRVALIEMPPHANAEDAVDCPGVTFARGALRDTVDWFVETPVVLRTKNGFVVDGT